MTNELRAPVFPAPLAPAPPHTQYWQQDEEPWEVRALPDDAPGPFGHHWIAPDLADEAMRRKRLGLPPICYPSPEWAPKPGQRGMDFGSNMPTEIVLGEPAASVPAVEEETPPPASTGRTPRAPRPPRAPRAPRATREPRAPRPPRPPRPPRAPRAPRKPRRPRKPRPPRPPRPNGTKNDEFDYYCGYTLATGRNAHFGSPLKVPKNAPVPTPAPGTGLRKVSGTFPCGDDLCTGPAAGLLEGFFDLLPAAWRPGIHPAQLALFNEANQRALEERNARLKSLPLRSPRRDPAPVQVNTGYCCQCGETGGCFTSVGDCRLAPVLQRRFGQC